VYEDIVFLDISQWNSKHLFRWKKMLEATDLAYESEGDLYCTFCRTRLVSLFPKEASLLRLVGAVLMETSEEWETSRKYLTFCEESEAIFLWVVH